MIDDLHRRDTHTNPHSKMHAINDWWIMGIYYGFRSSEYLQRSTVQTVAQAWLNETYGLPRAFIPSDVKFFAAGRVELSHDQALAQPFRVAFVNFRWREQKNGMSGQTKTVARDNLNPVRCPVLAAMYALSLATAPSTFPPLTLWRFILPLVSLHRLMFLY
jgi:hypothetical protein